MRIIVALLLVFYSVFCMAQEPAPVAVETTAQEAAPPSEPATPTASTPAPESTTAESASPPPTTTTEAAPAIGQVIWAKGQVSAMLPNQDKRALARRAPIYKEDTLESDKASSAQINFTDGSLLALAESTKLVLEKYNFNKADPSEDSYVMSIAKGGLRTVTGGISKGNPKGYKVKTPIATLAALGTEFSVYVRSNNDTLMAVKKGIIEATNASGKTVKLTAFDQRFAIISAANEEIKVLSSMPAEFNQLNTMKLDTKNINKTTPRGGGGSGGFCVGK